MKTEAENKRLFIEALELRDNVRACLHNRAKNNNDQVKMSCKPSGQIKKDTVKNR